MECKKFLRNTKDPSTEGMWYSIGGPFRTGLTIGHRRIPKVDFFLLKHLLVPFRGFLVTRFHPFLCLVDDVNLLRKAKYAFAIPGFNGNHWVTVVQSKKTCMIFCVFCVVILQIYFTLG